jgi:hypothetical protein
MPCCALRCALLCFLILCRAALCSVTLCSVARCSAVLCYVLPSVSMCFAVLCSEQSFSLFICALLCWAHVLRCALRCSACLYVLGIVFCFVSLCTGLGPEVRRSVKTLPASLNMPLQYGVHARDNFMGAGVEPKTLKYKAYLYRLHHHLDLFSTRILLSEIVVKGVIFL